MMGWLCRIVGSGFGGLGMGRRIGFLCVDEWGSRSEWLCCLSRVTSRLSFCLVIPTIHNAALHFLVLRYECRNSSLICKCFLSQWAPRSYI
jgi:hypothetical protein